MCLVPGSLTGAPVGGGFMVVPVDAGAHTVQVTLGRSVSGSRTISDIGLWVIGGGVATI